MQEHDSNLQRASKQPGLRADLHEVVLVHLPSVSVKTLATLPLTAATRIESPHGEKQQLRTDPACLLGHFNSSGRDILLVTTGMHETQACENPE